MVASTRITTGGEDGPKMMKESKNLPAGSYCTTVGKRMSYSSVPSTTSVSDDDTSHHLDENSEGSSRGDLSSQAGDGFSKEESDSVKKNSSTLEIVEAAVTVTTIDEASSSDDKRTNLDVNSKEEEGQEISSPAEKSENEKSDETEDAVVAVAATQKVASQDDDSEVKSLLDLLEQAQGGRSFPGTRGNDGATKTNAISSSSPSSFRDDFSSTSDRLIKASKITFAIWFMLTASTLLFSPQTWYERPALQTETQVCTVAFVLLLVSSISRFLPLIYKDRIILKDNSKILDNGFMVAAFTVQGIACMACGLMAFTKTPIVVDPITNGRVFLIRWCEWAPLVCLLTFLSEEIDVLQSNRKLDVHLVHSIAQGVCVSLGLVFPFVDNIKIWLSIVVIAFGLFSSLFVRIHSKMKRLETLTEELKSQSKKKAYNATSNHIFQKREEYSRLRLSLRSLQECAVLWTSLVVLHFVSAFAPRYLPVGHFVNTPSLPMITETLCEVVSKHLHILLIESVFTTFSERSRNIRTLEQLRRIMAVVWAESSDTIVVTAEGASKHMCIVSPMFFHLTGTPIDNKILKEDESSDDNDEPLALVFEIPTSATRNKQREEHDDDDDVASMLGHHAYCVRLSNDVELFPQNETIKPIPIPSSMRPGLLTLAELLEEAWKQGSSKTHGDVTVEDNTGNKQVDDEYDDDGAKKPISLVRDFVRKTTIDETNDGSSNHVIFDTVHCEATISWVERHAMVIVLRDVSERMKRFEIEKHLAVQEAEREKDSQANRFTRHEVKNGLLSAIGLCDSLKESLGPTSIGRNDIALAHSDHRKAAETSDVKQQDQQSTKNAEPLVELERTLHTVLDTIMSQAMSRDVVHEVYIPREESVDLAKILTPVRGEEPRFPVTMKAGKLPNFVLDPQLLRFIHVNAISNACKYGKPGGLVATTVDYECKSKLLTITIVNEPGAHHDKLVALGGRVSSQVFEAGRRLHTEFGLSFNQDNREVSMSAGDGCWIMKKCAIMLGGDVNITFNPTRTIFALKIRAKPVSNTLPEDEKDIFELPPTTWGIVIDDSRVQRKLAGRLLAFAGIHEDRRIILGATAEEILGFNDTVKSLVESNPDDKFFIIADENLDITGNRTVSGSICIEQLRQELHPDDESRILAVVRSANDSGYDIQLYEKRAHGTIKKTPLRPEEVLGMIRPLWTKRFPAEVMIEGGDSFPTLLDLPEAATGTACGRGPGSIASKSAIEREGGPQAAATTNSDLMHTIETIDEIMAQSTSEAEIWPSVREQFQVLKGDIMTLVSRSNQRVSIVLEALDDLRASSADQPPCEWRGRWKLIRALIESLG